MGTKVIIAAGAPLGKKTSAEAVEEVASFLLSYQERLSRFNPLSELNALNQDPRPVVPASELLCQAVAAALWAADFSSGLIDPTLLGYLEQSGYRDSWDKSKQIDLSEAIADLDWRPARASKQSSFRDISVREGEIERPPGLEIEIGGSGKGLAADLAAKLLDGDYQYWLINLGGDMRLGGQSPRKIEVVSPFDNKVVDSFSVTSGAVATSGIDSRLWHQDGKVYHHLLDPATGLPAYAGVISATAYAATALEAEVLAKMALLSGPEKAKDILEQGGILIYPDGSSERVGRLAKRRVVSVRLPEKLY